ncbi:MAG: hypothetical protein V4690_03725 [Patescibacteria group bacterium]
MKILFICKNNQFRSQMAAAIYNKLTKTEDAFSVGTYVGVPENPGGDPIRKFFRTTDLFELMEANDMYIRDVQTQKLLPEHSDNADVVVSMAEEPFIPDFLKENKQVIWWNVDNPPFATKEVSEEIYKQIHQLIENLLISSKKL